MVKMTSSAAAASDLPVPRGEKSLRRRLGRRRRGEPRPYSFRYVEPPSAARTKLADFFNILLRRSKVGIWVGMDREKTWVR